LEASTIAREGAIVSTATVHDRNVRLARRPARGEQWEPQFSTRAMGGSRRRLFRLKAETTS